MYPSKESPEQNLTHTVTYFCMNMMCKRKSSCLFRYNVFGQVSLKAISRPLQSREKCKLQKPFPVLPRHIKRCRQYDVRVPTRWRPRLLLLWLTQQQNIINCVACCACHAEREYPQDGNRRKKADGLYSTGGLIKVDLILYYSIHANVKSNSPGEFKVWMKT